jgi:hypothetical protein
VGRVLLVDDQRGGEGRVEPGDPDHRVVVAELAHEAVGRTLQRPAADERGHGDDVLAPGLHGGAHSVDRQQRPDRHDRVGRGDHDRLGGGEGLAHPGGRFGALGPGEAHGRDGDVVAAPDEVVLERDLLAAVGQRQHRAQPVVGGREDGHLEAPAPCDLARHRRQWRSVRPAAGAVQVGPEVAVAEAEPRVAAVALQRGHGVPGLVPQAPAAVGVDGAGHRVHDRVEVGADRQPVHLHVVGHVDHRGHVGRGDDPHQPGEQAGGPDAPAQDGDAHPGRGWITRCP